MRRLPRVIRGLQRLPNRITRFVHALFGGGATEEGWGSADAEGGVGVREPRRPLTPSLKGGATLDLPTNETNDSR